MVAVPIFASSSVSCLISVAPAGKDLRLSLSMRVSFDGRFTVGGKEQSSKDILFKYDAAKKSWSAVADHLKDMTSGADAASGGFLKKRTISLRGSLGNHGRHVTVRVLMLR